MGELQGGGTGMIGLELLGKVGSFRSQWIKRDVLVKSSKVNVGSPASGFLVSRYVVADDLFGLGRHRCFDELPNLLQAFGHCRWVIGNVSIYCPIFFVVTGHALILHRRIHERIRNGVKLVGEDLGVRNFSPNKP